MILLNPNCGLFFILNFLGMPVRDESGDVLYFDTEEKAELFCVSVLHDLLTVCREALTECQQVCTATAAPVGDWHNSPITHSYR